MPALALVAFWFGVLAGLVALGSLVGVVGSGIAGEYSDPAIVSWAASSGVMIASFAVAIWIGARATKRRGIAGGFVRRDLGAATAILLAAAATVALEAANIGGSFLPVLGDLLMVVFVASLVGCNLRIRPRLRDQPE